MGGVLITLNLTGRQKVNVKVQTGKQGRHGQDRVARWCLLKPNNTAYRAVEVGGLYRCGLMRDRCVVNRLGKKLSVVTVVLSLSFLLWLAVIRLKYNVIFSKE